jgi:putative Mn2+ efflux pump MntP
VNLSTILVLSVGLAMDATAVAAARGCAASRLCARDVVRVGAFFGGFQALMPLLGWGVGGALGSWVQAFDHWIAFVLLAAIGAKMLWEALRSGGECAPGSAAEIFSTRVLLALAVATSLDAFAVGITLPLLDAPLALSLVSIGTVTAVLSAAGLLAGRRLGGALGPRLDAFGGVVLIALGVRILAEHLANG